ncbi:MAG: VanZ family protein [Candidatus Omnitrophota bacterium]
MKLFKLWVPVGVWAGVIFYFSSIPDLKTGLEYDFALRKIAHIIEYFIFVFLLYRAFRGSFNMNVFRLFMYPAAFSLLYAISDEIHQYYILGRSCSMGDVLIDSIGIICFYIVIKFKNRALTVFLEKTR